MTRTLGNTRFAFLKLMLAALLALTLLPGCGSDDKPNNEDNDDKKPASERVAILKQRFDQLESSLDAMERDIEIQKKGLEKTRQSVKAIRRSLIQGNLKGYSIDTVTTEAQAILLQKMEKKHNEKKDDDKEDKKKAENAALNFILIVGFICFLIAIFWVALKDRNQTAPYEVSAVPYPPENNPAPAPSESADATQSTSGYQELGRRPDAEGQDQPRNEDTQQ